MQQTDVNLDILDSLDFEPCCEGFHQTYDIDCDRKAEWMTEYSCGHPKLICTPHKDWVVELSGPHGKFWCPVHEQITLIATINPI